MDDYYDFAPKSRAFDDGDFEDEAEAPRGRLHHDEEEANGVLRDEGDGHHDEAGVDDLQESTA
jgi:hypothetical protein